MNFKDELESALQGRVRFDKLTRKIYSVDASIYEIEPAAVALPESAEEVSHAAELCSRYRVPLIARGAATGISGGCLGKGLILDLAKHFNRILEINPKERFAVVEPGVVQDELNLALKPHGLRLGPETSTGNRATIGGMLANNAAGARSLVWGKMSDHLLELDLVLADGSLQTFYGDERDRGHPLHSKLKALKETYREEIEARFPKLHRRVSGYSLDSLPDLCKLIAGSEGTLGIATRIKLSLTPLPERSLLYLFAFDSLEEAMQRTEELLQLKPRAVELIDREIIERGRSSPRFRGRLGWLKSSPEALLIAEFGAPPPLQDGIPLEKREEQEAIWELRQAGLELLLSKRSFQRALAFIEDIAVPTGQLAPFMGEFLDYMQRCGRHAGIYGHAGAGCLHIRPYIDLRKEEDLRLMKKIMVDVSDLLLKHGGAMSGEHGDGLVRSWLNEKMFGKTLYRAFLEVKRLFDPLNIMNPGKVVEGGDPLSDLRNEPGLVPASFSPFQDFSKEGGFTLAADLCNGNGLCRKRSGTMCPSFQATNDEFDTTRARAQTLRSLIWGRLSPPSLGHPDLIRVLDLCLACKACKKECPSQIDMAKFKAEALFCDQEERGYSLRTRLFGHLPKISRIASLFPRWTPPKLLLDWLDISTEAPLPRLAKEPFRKWWRRQKQPAYGKRALLFIDTFTEFYAPEIGIAAAKLLWRLGYRLLLPERLCCGRSYLSKGMLKQAKREAEKTYEALSFCKREGLPLVGLEPSCLFTLKEELPSLMGGDLSANCLTLEELLLQEAEPLSIEKPLLLHGHCHQKASSEGMEPTRQLLDRLGADYEEIPSGCCGMAGSFGLEKEHASISKKIGELVLFPAVRASRGRLIVANGFSCRQQIELGTGEKALHLAQLLV